MLVFLFIKKKQQHIHGHTCEVWLSGVELFSASRCRLIKVRYFLKSFRFLFANLTSGRRNNGDASGVPSHKRKTEELLQQHRQKVHWQQNHRPGLRSRHTGERKEPRGRCLGVRILADRDRGLALGALPENEDVLRCWLGMLSSFSAWDSLMTVTIWRNITHWNELTVNLWIMA